MALVAEPEQRDKYGENTQIDHVTLLEFAV